MRVLIKKTISMLTGEVLEEIAYDYQGPVWLCCSSGDSGDASLEATQDAMTTTLNNAFSQSFSANQSILKNLTAQLNSVVANPQGFSPSTLASMRTSASDTTARQFASSARSAGAFAMSHAGTGTGSGVAAQIGGQVAEGAAAQDSSEQNQISIQNGLLQNQNYWNGINGLSGVAAQYNPTGYANSGANIANSATSASSALLASQQAGWQDVGGVISGVAGLGEAAANSAGALGVQV